LKSGTDTNTPSASNAGWIGTYPGSLQGGMCVRSAGVKTERKIKKMGKIVIKTNQNGDTANIEVRDFEEIDAAIMTICAFVKIVSGLNRESKKSAMYAAGIILKGVADKADSEQKEEQKDEDNSN
jgi:hypothetical protein